MSKDEDKKKALEKYSKSNQSKKDWLDLEKFFPSFKDLEDNKKKLRRAISSEEYKKLTGEYLIFEEGSGWASLFFIKFFYQFCKNPKYIFIISIVLSKPSR